MAGGFVFELVERDRLTDATWPRNEQGSPRVAGPAVQAGAEVTCQAVVATERDGETPSMSL